MKKLIVFAIPTMLLLMFATSTASAQVGGVISNQVQILELPDHPLHAEPHEMAIEHPLVGQGPNTYTYAKGERPLSDFPNPEQVEPLGDIARAYRQQKLAAKKATTILNKQGS